MSSKLPSKMSSNIRPQLMPGISGSPILIQNVPRPILPPTALPGAIMKPILVLLKTTPAGQPMTKLPPKPAKTSVPSSDSSGPRKLAVDEYIEQNSHVFRHGKGEFLVDCIVCDRTFRCPTASTLRSHVSRSTHRKLAEIEAKAAKDQTLATVDKRILVQKITLLKTYDFLEEITDPDDPAGPTGILQCRFCGPGFRLRAPFHVHNGIYKHVNKKEHRRLAERNVTTPNHSDHEESSTSDRFTEKLNEKSTSPELITIDDESPEPSRYPKKATTSSDIGEDPKIWIRPARKAQKTPEERQADAIRCQLHKYPDLLAVNVSSGLFCVPCGIPIGSRDFGSNYTTSVRTHLASMWHESRLKAYQEQPVAPSIKRIESRKAKLAAAAAAGSQKPGDDGRDDDDPNETRKAVDILLDFSRGKSLFAADKSNQNGQTGVPSHHDDHPTPRRGRKRPKLDPEMKADLVKRVKSIQDSLFESQNVSKTFEELERFLIELADSW